MQNGITFSEIIVTLCFLITEAQKNLLPWSVNKTAIHTAPKNKIKNKTEHDEPGLAIFAML